MHIRPYAAAGAQGRHLGVDLPPRADRRRRDRLGIVAFHAVLVIAHQREEIVPDAKQCRVTVGRRNPERVHQRAESLLRLFHRPADIRFDLIELQPGDQRHQTHRLDVSGFRVPDLEPASGKRSEIAVPCRVDKSRCVPRFAPGFGFCNRD